MDEKKKMARWKKILILGVVITVYLNVGWAMGAYYRDNVTYTPKEKLTFVGKIAAGWDASMAGKNHKPGDWSRQTDCAVSSVFWPSFPIVTGASWLACSAYYVGYAGYYVFWFIFAGGAAKLLGLG